MRASAHVTSDIDTRYVTVPLSEIGPFTDRRKIDGLSDILGSSVGPPPVCHIFGRISDRRK